MHQKLKLFFFYFTLYPWPPTLHHLSLLPPFEQRFLPFTSLLMNNTPLCYKTIYLKWIFQISHPLKKLSLSKITFIYMTSKLWKSIEPSKNQTKEWRKSQLWCLNGKHNACGRYQKSIIKGITKPTINKTHRLRGLKRFNDVKKTMEK